MPFWTRLSVAGLVGLSLALAATPGPAAWPAPAFRAERIDAPGRVLDLSEHLGRLPIVLNFWASWRVLFVGVNLQDTPGGARAFLQTYFWSFPNVRDAHGELARAYRVVGLPTTVFINAAGQVVRVHAGPLTAERLEAFVSALTQPSAP